MEYQNTYCLLSKLDNNTDISYEFHEAAYFPHCIKFCQTFCKDFFFVPACKYPVLAFTAPQNKMKLEETSGGVWFSPLFTLADTCSYLLVKKDLKHIFVFMICKKTQHSHKCSQN